MAMHQRKLGLGHLAALSMVGVVLSGVSCSSSESTITPTDLTWNQDIGPLAQAHCGTCHYPGGAGHFDLLHYESMKAWAPVALSEMKGGRMPPWPPSSTCREYKDTRALPADVVPKFEEWIAGGMPQGEGEAVAFMPTQFEELRRDLQATMSEAYTPNASVTDDYRCFVLDLEFPTDTWIEGVDVRPGTPQVHHVLTYAMAGGALDAALEADSKEAGPGYTCYGGPNPKSSGGMGAGLANGFPVQVGAWVPGFQAQPLPADTALRIPGGSRLVMQVHYNTASGNPAPDQSSILLQTHPGAPKFVYRTVPIAQPQLNIEAGDPASAHSITLTNWASSPTTFMSAAGHMHVLGQHLRGTVLRSDDTQECLLDIPNWDFKWQMQYKFVEDQYAVVRPGDSIKLDCVYDNSAKNQPVVDGVPREPQDVTWGEGTYDEMCLMYLGTIAPYEPPAPAPKTACEAASACTQACNPRTASCLLNCEDVGIACLTCTIKGMAGCGAVACLSTLQAMQACQRSCVLGVNAFGGSIGECMSNTCPNEWKAATECLDPFFADPACASALTGCGI